MKSSEIQHDNDYIVAKRKKEKLSCSNQKPLYHQKVCAEKNLGENFDS